MLNQQIANKGQLPYTVRNDISGSVSGDDVLDHELVAVFHETQAFELVPHHHSSLFQHGQAVAADGAPYVVPLWFLWEDGTHSGS
jgi:hypothetical protein